MRCSATTRGLASVSTLASATLPSRSVTAFSSTGVSWRHGPHQAAQKSTTTGSSRERSTTSAWKVASVASKITPPRIAALLDLRAWPRSSSRPAGSTLAGEEAGEGTPVVLLHGLTATRRYVVMGSRALQRDGHRVVAYDARGHGASSPAPSPDAYGYEDARGRPARGARRPRHRPRAARRRLDGRAHARALRARPRRPRRRASSSSRRPSTRTTRRTRSGGSPAGTRSRRGCARAGWRASSRPTAPRSRPSAGTRRSSRCCASGSSAHEHPEALADALRAVPALAPVRGLVGARGARRSPRSSSPAATRPTPSTRTRSASATPRRSRARSCARRSPGSSPMAWQGSQLSAVIAELGARAVSGCATRGERRHPRHQHDRALDHGLVVVGGGEAPAAVVLAAGDEAGAVAGAERDLGPGAAQRVAVGAAGRRGGPRRRRSRRRRARRRSRSRARGAT